MISARPAGPEDAPAVAQLRAVGLAEARERRGGPQFVDGELAVPVAPSVVGLVGDVVVGMAALELDGERGRLAEILTHPDARGVGVGHAMLAEVERLARHAGCTRLDSVALPGDRETKNFFESHGLTSRLLVVSRQL